MQRSPDHETHAMSKNHSRREFLFTTGAAGLGMATFGLARPAAGRAGDKIGVLSIGVVGTIGARDRREVNDHPNAEIVGLCDVDADYLARAKNEHPGAFTCKDYREAFANHADEFDAVIVATPDHTHGPIMLTALAHGKHVYGQKPLVQQLEELILIERAIAANPQLVTQTGNQRMVFPGRRAAVEILRSGVLGKAVEAYAWTGAPNRGNYFNFDGVVSDPLDPPAHLDWNLWRGPCQEQPYRDQIVPARWRSWWDFGTGGLGDWGVHVLDVIFFGYDELVNPIAVVTHTPKAADRFHWYPCSSTITYAVDSERFVNKHFPIHYNDQNQAPSRAALGLPAGKWGDKNMTVVVCEGGVLTLTAGGDCKVWREGKLTPGLEMPGLPPFPQLNHWHAWVDNINGVKTELRTPFKDGVRITEAALLGAKAARFPGEELRWNREKLQFTGNMRATRELVGRDYREGFGPPEA